MAIEARTYLGMILAKMRLNELLKLSNRYFDCLLDLWAKAVVDEACAYEGQGWKD